MLPFIGLREVVLKEFEPQACFAIAFVSQYLDWLLAFRDLISCIFGQSLQMFNYVTISSTISLRRCASAVFFIHYSCCQLHDVFFGFMMSFQFAGDGSFFNDKDSITKADKFR
jgi:hypothetical protein